MKLYEITTAYQNIADLMSDPELATSDEVIHALEQVSDNFNDKAVNIIKLVKHSEGDIEILDGEIKRLQTLKKVRQNNIERVKNYLKQNMSATGILKIESPLFKITYNERKEAAVELDEEIFLANNVDEDLVTVTVKPNKTEIKNALKRGADILGAKLVDSQVLTIS
ncbi:hypothetical protein A4G19_13835 [Pasteurellaceae bacterium Macca]|nr:hypothetical protein [Pasteurellaceae bacterium Macca]MCK3656759.1 hypothetical protein [Pasteurellaceae bacterium Macca]